MVTSRVESSDNSFGVNMSATFQLWGIPTHMKGASYIHPAVMLFEALYRPCTVAFRR